MNPVQSLLALLVGMGLFRLVVSVLETVLVGAGPPMANSPTKPNTLQFATSRPYWPRR